MKKLYVILFLTTLAGGLQAQTTNTSPRDKSAKEQRKLKKIAILREQEEGENVFQRDFSVGARLNTDGWSGFAEMGYRKSRKVVNYFQFEFSEKKDHKETRQQGGNSGGFFSDRPYIFGKQNNFYPLKLGVGQRYLLGGKGNKNGVEVSAIYYGGISVGLVKPYYLMINKGSGGNTEPMKYDPNITDLENPFLKFNEITGSGGFGRGWGELSVIPGLHAKVGMRFDWAHFNEVVSALEVGINAEMYTKKVPIMITENNKQFFFNAYVGLQFGKRWNRK
ncbi:hypothetical protein [Chitinophaga nivalis]|uniref:Outer membrane protein beta-barrel domain-containing protein n=1 Tax=Chitinophaga nivalis TaxID=2991709 RepID=A0ABT3IRQ0_9BACT|nr:hypothetical protein [Chitinophaga nivalis]MCW3463653.1 hypothetical protein [Chitinophaga nivalis]MCW3486657.1 hypothetical protein [Chitinophaga nivalis]